MIQLKPLHDPSEGALRVVGLMSGSGTNLRRILERQRAIGEEEGGSPFELAVIFSNDVRSSAPRIGADFDIPVIIRDMRSWYARRNAPTADLDLRRDFDAQTLKALSPYSAHVAAYGGYMAIATGVLTEAFLGINVHPADLSINDDEGARRFTGDHAVRDAILAGEKTIASSTHIIESEVDMGRLLMISDPLTVEIPTGSDMNDPNVVREIESVNQDRLKEAGDWIVLPRTIEYIARGRYAQDDNGNLYFDGEPIPKGARL